MGCSSCEMPDKCKSCNPSKCCTFTGLSVPTPTTRDSFDNLLFHVSHENVEVFQREDNIWLVMFRTRCEHLLFDGSCGIYETRPNVCRWYPIENCEKDNPLAAQTKRVFLHYNELLEFVNSLTFDNKGRLIEEI